MPVSKSFELIRRFKNIKEFKQYRMENRTFSFSNTKYGICQMCHIKSHKMKTQYGICSNKPCLESGICPVEYKATTCLKYNDKQIQKINLYSLDIDHKSDEIEKHVRGLTDTVKEIVEEIIHDYDAKPKRIFIRLTTKKKYKYKIDFRPMLSQVQTYISYRRRQVSNNNSISEIKSFCDSHRYELGVTNDNELFVFGDEMGTGADESHFHLGFTSIKLLKSIDEFKNKGCYHIDATYKIVKYSYPLIVLGFTDLQKQFFPICFMFTSHEQEDDYNHFFESFLDICDRHNIKFKPKFIVSDACRALVNAMKNYLPNCKYLMCWFHLKMNVRKHKNLIPNERYQNVLNDINALHNSKCQASYNLLLKMTLQKWLKNSQLLDFVNYFKKQWLDSVFNSWQIYLTPAGYAHTNSPIESYNNTIKAHFTNRIKYHMIPALEVFQTCIEYESNNLKRIVSEGKVTQFMLKQAKDIIKQKKLIQNGGNRYNYQHYNDTLGTIDTLSKFCTCEKYLDKAICKHLVAACIKDDIALNGIESSIDKLIYKKRKPMKRVNDSILDEDDQIATTEQTIEQAIEQLDELAIEQPNEQVVKKRGRSIKNNTLSQLPETQNQTKPKRGRPRLTEPKNKS